jgi:hypothetical protein
LYEPFYVGKGKNNRAYAHFKNIKKIDKLNKSNNTYKNIILKKILENNLEPYVLIVGYYNNNIDAVKSEKYYISLIGRKDLKLGLLGNLTNGGDGISNISDETRIRMSESHKGKTSVNINQLKNYWKNLTKDELSKRAKHACMCRKNIRNGSFKQEVKDKISKSLLGRKKTEETKIKQSHAAKIRENSKSDIQKKAINLKISISKKLKQHEPSNKMILKNSKLEKHIVDLFNQEYSIKDILTIYCDLTCHSIRRCLQRNGFKKLYRRSKFL